LTSFNGLYAIIMHPPDRKEKPIITTNHNFSRADAGASAAL
jgi:hypothetical protein